MSRFAVRMSVNGREREGFTEARKTLADFLREDLQLTGTHLGCEHGVCGACTVLVDGEAIRSCLMFAVQADGCDILTIEGLEVDGELSVLQEAMRDSHSFQCGFCTPGFMMTAYALLRDEVDRTDAQWREDLAGNLCRCTGYQSILEGVQLAAARLASDREAAK